MPTPDPTAEPTALVVEENIYASICAHAYLQMDQRQKKHKIRQKHRTPSEKEKKEHQKCSNVYTFFTSTLKEITA